MRRIKTGNCAYIRKNSCFKSIAEVKLAKRFDSQRSYADRPNSFAISSKVPSSRMSS